MSRPKGTTKEIMSARRNLEVLNKLRDLVDEEAVVASVELLINTMKNPSTGASTARMCANDILGVYFKLHKDSIEVLAEHTTPSPEKGSKESSSKATGTDGTKLISLTFNKDKDKE